MKSILLLGHGYSQYVYSQIGIGGRIELGIDSYNIGQSSETYLNGKYLIANETPKSPALAVGIRNVSTGSEPSYYAVGCKTFLNTRLHLGVETQSGDEALIIGADYAVGNLTFLVDWETGEGYYSLAGVYWQATPLIGVNLYWAQNNTHSLRDTSDYVGLYTGYTINLK